MQSKTPFVNGFVLSVYQDQIFKTWILDRNRITIHWKEEKALNSEIRETVLPNLDHKFGAGHTIVMPCWSPA